VCTAQGPLPRCHPDPSSDIEHRQIAAEYDEGVRREFVRDGRRSRAPGPGAGTPELPLSLQVSTKGLGLGLTLSF
jgi:hypothetical protein